MVLPIIYPLALKMMNQSQDIPNIKIVKEQSKLNTFIAEVYEGCDEHVLQAIEMQCKSIMVIGELGFATLAQKMDGGHYLVVSLPTNTRADYIFG